jgi:hypothetical protein
MGIRLSRSCFCLSLLASLWASGAAPATADPIVPTAGVGITFSSSSVSAIPIDVEALTQGLCDTARKGTGHLVKCVVIVHNGGYGLGKFTLGEPLVTPCGTWDAELTADPSGAQPSSPIAFTEVPDDPRRGVFAGIWTMNTNLHLTNRDTGQTADSELRLGFSLAGPWVLASPDEPSTTDQRILLADYVDGEIMEFVDCIPVDIIEKYSSVEIVKGYESCRVCMNPLAFMTVSPDSGDAESTPSQSPP